MSSKHQKGPIHLQVKKPEATKHDMTRSSILEFEKLEQECNNKFSPHQARHSPPHQNKMQPHMGAADAGRKRKKLFDDDSDSDGEKD